MNKKTIKAYTLKNAIEHKGKAIAGSVIAGLFNHGLKKNKIKDIMKEVNDVLKQINKLSIDEQKKEFKGYEKIIRHRAEREGLPELPGAKKGKVVTRFAPSASGPMHLGHILTIGPNFLYVKKYGGKFYIRVEDTNPDNIYKPAYKMIKEESKWLCGNKIKIIIQSERMNLYYKYAEKLVNSRNAYVCDCDTERFRKLILRKEVCPCRKLSKEKQIKRWEKMLDKTNKGYKQGQAVLRFKSNLENKNPAMRDFPLARINTNPHPLQKKKYKVWPLMNLAVTVDDINLKITHIIRGKDHRDNAKRQKMIYKALGKSKQYPWIGFIGRLHFKGLEMSTTKIKQGIEQGKFKGWDDQRLPTAISLKKQGYKPEAFWKFVEQKGISEVDKIIDKKDFFEVLDNFNRQVK